MHVAGVSMIPSAALTVDFRDSLDCDIGSHSSFLYDIRSLRGYPFSLGDHAPSN